METWHWHVLDGHAQVTDGTGTECAMQDGHGVTAWRYAGRWPALYVCALRKGNDGDMCEQSLAAHPFHKFCCKYGGARNRPHRAVQSTLRRLIEQVEGYADMERHVPELYDQAKNKDEAAPVMRCAILDVVSWFPGVQLDRRQRAMPACRTLQRKCVATMFGCRRKRNVMERPCARWSSRHMEDWAARAPSCCVISWPRRRANGQCSPHAVGRWRTQLTLASTGISSCGASCC